MEFELKLDLMVTTQHRGDERKGLKKRVRQCWSAQLVGLRLPVPAAKGASHRNFVVAAGVCRERETDEEDKTDEGVKEDKTDEGVGCLIKVERRVGGGRSGRWMDGKRLYCVRGVRWGLGGRYAQVKVHFRAVTRFSARSFPDHNSTWAKGHPGPPCR